MDLQTSYNTAHEAYFKNSECTFEEGCSKLRTLLKAISENITADTLRYAALAVLDSAPDTASTLLGLIRASSLVVALDDDIHVWLNALEN